MPRKPSSRSKSVKSKSKVDKRQDKQILALRKLVVSEKPLVEEIETATATIPAVGYEIINMINYDNRINKLIAPPTSRTYFRHNSRLFLTGNQSGQTQADSNRVVRVLYFMWKATVYKSSINFQYYLTPPAITDIFDVPESGSNPTGNNTTALARLSYKNRKRIRVLKDVTTTLTNHSSIDNDRIVKFNKNSKYGMTYHKPTDDALGEAVMWMPYILILDGAGSAQTVDNLKYTMVNHNLFNEEE